MGIAADEATHLSSAHAALTVGLLAGLCVCALCKLAGWYLSSTLGKHDGLLTPPLSARASQAKGCRTTQQPPPPPPHGSILERSHPLAAATWGLQSDARASSDASGPEEEPPVVFVGTGSALIYAFGFSGEDGRLSPLGNPTPAGAQPTWVCPDLPHRRRLFSVDEAPSDGGCSAFAIQRGGSSPLLPRGRVADPLSPSGPCHCAVDATGRWLLASNYAHGSICVYEIDADAGSLGRVVDAREFGSETRPSHAHCGP
jgi:hypothetical protein